MSFTGDDQQHIAWPVKRRILWSLLFVCALGLSLRGYAAAMRPPEGAIYDFFKEWAAVRNWSVGQPIYRDQTKALEEHLGLRLTNPERFFDSYNTHPPTANWIAFPFVQLSYRDAHFAWNLVSLGLFGVTVVWIVKGLGLKVNVWMIVSLITMLLVCDPLMQSLIQGQPNLLLGLLIAGAWRFARTERPAVAGTCLGVATAVKLFPAFLFLYFIVRRDWRTVTAGVVSLCLISVGTVAVFGVDAYRDYFTVVLPSLADVTNNWGNASIVAFWERLFEDSAASVQPLFVSPELLQIAIWSSYGVVTIVTVSAIRKSRNEDFSDAAYALTIVAMLLLTPTTWHHYFILLAVPVGYLLTQYKPATSQRWMLNLAIAALVLTPRLIWLRLIPIQSAAKTAGAQPWENGNMIAQPWQSLSALSYQMYALVAMFFLLYQANLLRWNSLRRRGTQDVDESTANGGAGCDVQDV